MAHATAFQNRHRFPFLPMLAVALAATPTLVRAQSFVGGNLSVQAPYGLPASDFLSATTNPVSQVQVAIQGYNVSAPAGPSSGNLTTGWTLGAAVAADVSLARADAKVVDTTKFTQATTLRIAAPQGMTFNASAWRLCAVVFAAGLTLDSSGRSRNATGGDCGAALPSDCVKTLQVSGVAGNADGTCHDITTLPNKCQGYFAGSGDGTSYELTPDVVSANRFFAAGSAPVDQGNRSALAAAEGAVWPVLLTWTHFASDGQVHDSNGYLSCLKVASTASSSSGASVEAPGSRARTCMLLVGVALAACMA